MSGLLGVRAPRFRVVPSYAETLGPVFVEAAARADLRLDGWQCDALDDFQALQPGGRWNTFENGVIVSRQNGKGGIFEARVLGGLFVIEEPLILYSAHRFATAQEMFLRIKELITNCDEYRRRVKRIIESHGEQGIETLSGQRLRFIARSGNSGRGFTGWCNILDEAFLLDGPAISALMPTMSAVDDPQVFYGSSAGWEVSEQLGRVRRRALAVLIGMLHADGLRDEVIAERLGLPPEDIAGYLKKYAGPESSLAFLEWTAPDTTPRTKRAMADRGLWAIANPALGIRLSEEFTANELRTMSAADFARERLGIGDYPPDDDDEDGWDVIGETEWADRALQGEAPRPDRSGRRRPAFAIDMSPDRSMAAIGAAFRDEAGALIVEIVYYAAGSGVVARMVELAGKYNVAAVAIDKGGPASSLIGRLRDAGIEVMELTAPEVAAAYGQFVDAVTDSRELAHLDQEPLNDAVKGATDRPLGDRKTWDRLGDADICPLVAVTTAAYAHGEHADDDYEIAQSIG